MSVELPSLDTILQNLERNLVGFSEEDIETEKTALARTYQAYLLATTSDLAINAIAQQTGASRNSISRWRKNKNIPQTIREHYKNWFGNSDEEKRDFAFLLGTYARSTRVDEKSQIEFTRTPSNQRSKDRIEKVVERSFEGNARLNGTFKLWNRVIVNCLYQAFYDLDSYQYISTNNQRISFLQGLFDVSGMSLVESNGKLYHRTYPTQELTQELIIQAMFELGTYPLVRPDQKKIEISSISDLKRLVDLEIIVDDEEREKVNQQYSKNDKIEVTPETYYGIRRIVKGKIADGQDVSIIALAKEIGARPETVSRWIGDLMRASSKEQRIPKSVRRYDELCELLELPNVYAAAEPTQRNEKWFFPVGWRTYELPIETQQSYLRQTGKAELDEDDITQTWQYLQEETKDVEFTFDGSKIKAIIVYSPDQVEEREYEKKPEPITIICSEGSVVRKKHPGNNRKGNGTKGKKVRGHSVLEGIVIRANEQDYAISHGAAERYYKNSGLDPEPLNADDIEYLGKELTRYLTGEKERDLDFLVRNGVIKGVSVNVDSR